ncbi:hypothetical protein K443DRAFT_673149 [Laccaria amethystina LaAM-08-1]|uniref:Uncharacterized protein n=1 Tax=Laccaria amethystina LaAM-08-1 TaxID=1095629 RepID=A0A0C9X5W8_9AGAR|nr:hypothetical protein K443DRAFT_673149 [Laccaria amethystina LaAM-08-1]
MENGINGGGDEKWYKTAWLNESEDSRAERRRRELERCELFLLFADAISGGSCGRGEPYHH